MDKFIQLQHLRKIAPAIAALVESVVNKSGPALDTFKVTAEQLKSVDGGTLSPDDKDKLFRIVRMFETSERQKSNAVSEIIKSALDAVRPLQTRQSDPADAPEKPTVEQDAVLMVRFVFNEQGVSNEESHREIAPAQDVVGAFSALSRALAETEDNQIATAILQHQIDWSRADDLRRLLEVFGPWRIEFHSTESGSLIVAGAVLAVRHLWKAFELNERLKEAVISTFGETELVEDVKRTSLEVLNYPWHHLKAAIVRQLGKVGFQPIPVGEPSDKSSEQLRLQIPRRTPDQLRLDLDCCCSRRTA